MTNIIVSLILLVILASAVTKVVVEKRKGNKCIGCPHGGSHGQKKSAGTGCSCH